MNEDSSQAQAFTRFTDPLLAKLKRHPKRVVFTEGEDERVLRVARRLFDAEAVVPVLLGNAEAIRTLAARKGIDLEGVRVIEPTQSSDFPLFCRRFERTERYRSKEAHDVEALIAKPHYFGSMMIQYGQADALVGGNKALPAALFRALLQVVKPMSDIPKMFGVAVLSAPHLAHFGEEGMMFFADCGLTPEPDIEQLATMAIETGKLARHFLGRQPKVALLSHSTKGSASTEPARRIAAATALAREKALSPLHDLRIMGEVQADVAVDPDAAEVKLPGREHASSDVLIFPNLDAAHISMKLLQHCGGATNFGQLLIGLSRPAAQIPRTASENTILGTAAAVAVEAIKFHELYPDGEVDEFMPDQRG